MKVLYYVQIHSNLCYCLSMRGSMITNTNIKKIRKIQNQCIATLDKRLSVNDIYKKYQILTFKEMIKHETYKLWHKLRLKLLPCPLARNMKTDDTGLDLTKSHHYETRNKAYLNHPCAKNTYYSKSFLSKELKAYSELALKIKSCNRIGTFSSQCKNHLLSKMNDQ